MTVLIWWCLEYRASNSAWLVFSFTGLAWFDLVKYQICTSLENFQNSCCPISQKCERCHRSFSHFAMIVLYTCRIWANDLETIWPNWNTKFLRILCKEIGRKTVLCLKCLSGKFRLKNCCVRIFLVGGQFRKLSFLQCSMIDFFIKRLINTNVEQLLSCGFVSIYSLLRIIAIFLQIQLRSVYIYIISHVTNQLSTHVCKIVVLCRRVTIKV